MKYEYKVIPIAITADQSEEMLNDFGQLGWQVVTAYNNHFLLKRRQ